MTNGETYAASLEAQMLSDYVSGGMPLAQACRTLGVSPLTTYDRLSKWPEFADLMNRARDVGYDMIAVDCLEIADETGKDTVTTSRGEFANKEWMARSKLRVETRLKLLAKWHPKKYGEKLEIESKSASVAVPVGDDPLAAVRAYEALLKGS